MKSVKPNNVKVFIVDDDEAVRDSLSLLLELKGHRTETFASAEDFLAAWRPECGGCLVLDIRMPGMSGLALQKRLAEMAVRLPVILVSAHGDIAATRDAFKAGAVDFIEKPIDDRALLAAVHTALERDAERRRIEAEREEVMARLERLTDREREVLDLVVGGQHNREIAAVLGISPRTVEVYKARLMEKLQVRRSSELIRLMLNLRQARAA